MKTLGLDALACQFADYDLELSPAQLSQVQAYLELLLRWNRRVNLTAIREPRRIVRELFCESMYLTRVLPLSGSLLDIGSGAGFPGLALKLVAPELSVVLLEPRQRRCAFLKEAVRFLHVSDITVEAAPMSQYGRGYRECFEIATTRGVAMTAAFLENAQDMLKPRGALVVFTTQEIAMKTVELRSSLKWRQPIPMPHSRERCLLIGAKRPL